jgi:Na+/citrate or Na+/malate symporter
MKNITLAMVAALVAVTMLSAVLAVAPMQQANATLVQDGDSKVKTGDNKVKIKQSNECKKVIASCGNFIFGEIDQNSGDDSPGMSNNLG